MSTFSKASIADELERNADWRRGKAIEYPEDIRNTQAAAILDQLLDQVGKLKDDHPLIKQLNAVEDELVAESGGDLLELSEDVGEYHRDVGFHRFPEFIEDYLKGLVELHERLLVQAREAADRDHKALENRVRRKAGRRGYRVYKSRQQEHYNNQGEFMLVNERNCVVLGDRFDATLEDIEAHLAEVPL